MAETIGYYEPLRYVKTISLNKYEEGIIESRPEYEVDQVFDAAYKLHRQYLDKYGTSPVAIAVSRGVYECLCLKAQALLRELFGISLIIKDNQGIEIHPRPDVTYIDGHFRESVFVSHPTEKGDYKYV